MHGIQGPADLEYIFILVCLKLSNRPSISVFFDILLNQSVAWPFHIMLYFTSRSVIMSWTAHSRRRPIELICLLKEYHLNLRPCFLSAKLGVGEHGLAEVACDAPRCWPVNLKTSLCQSKAWHGQGKGRSNRALRNLPTFHPICSEDWRLRNCGFLPTSCSVRVAEKLQNVTVVQGNDLISLLMLQIPFISRCISAKVEIDVWRHLNKAADGAIYRFVCITILFLCDILPVVSC